MDTSIKDIIKSKLAEKDSFSTAELRSVLLAIYPGIPVKTIAWKIYQLKDEGFLHQIGRGTYSFTSKPIFLPELSLKTKRLYNKVKAYSKGIQLVVWDTQLISELLDKEIKKHYIFIALPKEKLEETFHELLDLSKKIFLNPNQEIIHRYLLPQEEAVILLPLSTETPTIQIGDFQTLAIEGLLVKAWLMEDDYLEPLGIDIKELFQKAYSKYNINESKLLRYAARRDKRSEIEQLIKNLS